MGKIFKTPYQWCIDSKIRVLDLNEWPIEIDGSKEKHFFNNPYVTKEDFLGFISKCKVKHNSLQRKTTMFLEYRMYGLVNYQLSGTIHAGIQYGHAVVEYGQAVKNKNDIREQIYDKWAVQDKTFIILNGGTTNNDPNKLGTLNKSLKELLDNEIFVLPFTEPDLNDALTAIVFLVDERVFNTTLYPDYVNVPYPWKKRHIPTENELSKWEEVNNTNYLAWEEKIGGPKNAFLRRFLRPLKLA